MSIETKPDIINKAMVWRSENRFGRRTGKQRGCFNGYSKKNRITADGQTP
jgi:hypothetical protein